MAHYIIQAVFFQLIFLLVYELLLKKETFFNYNRLYLLCTPIVALALPFLNFETLENVVPTRAFVMLPDVVIGESSMKAETLETETNTQLLQLNWWLILYALGVVFSTFLFLKKYSILKRLFGYRIVSEAKEWKIIEVPQSKIACTFYKTIFLGDQISEAEKQQILAHELVHVKQKHSLDLVFFEIQKILFWFNPLVYAYQTRIAGLHEYIADAQVVKSGGKKTYYQQLLNTAFNTENISFINQFFNHSLIKKRIVMLQKSKSRSTAKFKYLVLAPILFAMLTYVSCSPAQNDVLNSEEQMAPPPPPAPPAPPVAPPPPPPPYEAWSIAEVEQVPVYPGCEDLATNEERKSCMAEKISAFVNSNFNTKAVKQYASKGVNRIYVQFTIGTSGEVVNINSRASHPELEAEAVRVIQSLPTMEPAQHNGANAAVMYALPIVFEK